MTKTRLIILFVLLPAVIAAQNRIGLTAGDYSGANGIIMNPSSGVNSRYHIDVQLAGAGVFIKNNYLFLRQEDYSMTGLLFRNPDFPSFIDELGNERYVDETYHKGLKSGYFNTRVYGPSFLVNKGNYSYGLYTAVRAAVMVKNSSYDVSKFVYEHFDYPPLHNIKFKNEIDMHFETLNFLETGINYGQNIMVRDFAKLDIGVNFKYLQPHSGAKAYIDNADYVVPNSDTLIVFQGDGTLKFAVPVDYNNNNYSDNGSFFKGSGFGADIGLTYTKTGYYQRTKQSGKRYMFHRSERYKYRIGFSVLDLGYITFNKNAQLHEYTDVSTFWTGIDDYEYVSINSTMGDISENFYDDGNRSKSLVDDEFTMLLPTTLSLQMDYHYTGNWYFHSVLMYNINKKANGFNRPHYLGLMPRFEKPYYGFGVPVSMYNFRRPQLGLNIRLFFLNIGTSNLSHYVGISSVSNLDVYVSIKFNLLKAKKLLFGGADCHEQEK